MKALIDGDIVSYRCAAVNENAEPPLAAWQSDELINRIIEDVNADDWVIYLSGSNNFRYNLYPEYKANRRDAVKPKHLEHIREYLVTTWDARIVDGIEADDQLGIDSQRGDCTAVVCSIDKDLLQLPGWHYNFVQRKLTEISEENAIYNFYYQLLVGDPTDNIKGCPGIGKVNATKILAGTAPNESSIFLAVADAYKAQFSLKKLEGWEDSLLLNGSLLYIHRKEEDEWNFPQPLPHTEDQK